MTQVSESPVPLSEPALDDLQVGGDSWAGREMPSKDLEMVDESILMLSLSKINDSMVECKLSETHIMIRSA